MTPRRQTPHPLEVAAWRLAATMRRARTLDSPLPRMRGGPADEGGAARVGPSVGRRARRECGPSPRRTRTSTGAGGPGAARRQRGGTKLRLLLALPRRVRGSNAPRPTSCGSGPGKLDGDNLQSADQAHFAGTEWLMPSVSTTKGMKRWTWTYEQERAPKWGDADLEPLDRGGGWTMGMMKAFDVIRARARARAPTENVARAWLRASRAGASPPTARGCSRSRSWAPRTLRLGHWRPRALRGRACFRGRLRARAARARRWLDERRRGQARGVGVGVADRLPLLRRHDARALPHVRRKHARPECPCAMHLQAGGHHKVCCPACDLGQERCFCPRCPLAGSNRDGRSSTAAPSAESCATLPTSASTCSGASSSGVAPCCPNRSSPRR